MLGITPSSEDLMSLRLDCRYDYRLAVAIYASSLALADLSAQEREGRTLLSQRQMTSIISEVSGDRAMNHLLELVPYQRVRPPSEYDGNVRESVVLAAMAKSFGYSNVTTEKYQRAVRTWSGARAHARSR